MGLNSTPIANRLHIGLFGRTNAGKSSLINAITNQDIAIVSDVLGTTTDPVYKTMEILPIGPVVIIDTPGLDDDSPLGRQRIKRSYDVLKKTDVAIIVATSSQSNFKEELKLIGECKNREIPYILALNKSDLNSSANVALPKGIEFLNVSAKTGENIDKLKHKLIESSKPEVNQPPLVGDLMDKEDVILLVVPIDKAAPKGRLILPQQQVIRDILDHDGICVAVKENSLKKALTNLQRPPKMVITDSQVFKEVERLIPKDMTLTSFSILFARKNGVLKQSYNGVKAIDTIKDTDRILICEGCTHHRQCDDIGSVKIPAWIRKYTKKNPSFEFTSGVGFKEDLTPYKLVIHCGGCMLPPKEMENRLKTACLQNVKFTNYGILIAYLNGILERAVSVFKTKKYL